MPTLLAGPFPRSAAAGYDAKLRTGAFTFQWDLAYQLSEYGTNWQGVILRFGNTNDCLYFNRSSTAMELVATANSADRRWAVPFTWTGNSGTITFTVDVPNSRVTIAGAATGNGQTTVTSWSWQLGDGTLRAGDWSSGAYTVDPQLPTAGFYDPPSSGTTINTTGALTGSGVVAAALKELRKISGPVTGLGTLASTATATTAGRTTSAVTGLGTLAGATKSDAKTTAPVTGLGTLAGALTAKQTANTVGALVGLGQLGGAATARVPSPYEATAFTQIHEYPPGQALITNVWPFGQPLLVRDRAGREIVCPTRSADGNMYLAISEDQGATWRAVSHTSGLGSDPLFNQNLLSMRQDSAGKYHLLSHDPNEGTVYTRFVLARNGSNVITGYTRETCIYRVFGDEFGWPEHVANVVIAKTAIGTECVVIHVQEGTTTEMTNYVIKSPTTTPTARTQFTRLDGTAGATEIKPAGLTHNAHEHVSHAGFFESNGALVFTRSHSAAEGFQNVVGYNDLYWMICPRAGDNWTLGTWQRYERPGEGLHTRAMCMADNRMFLGMPARDSGLHIASISDAGVFTIDAVPQPGQSYPPQSPYFYEADVGLACSRDGSRLFAYIASWLDSTTGAAFFADYSAAGGWRRDESPAHTAPWWTYGPCVSTGDGFGIYIARGDGTYGNTRPTFGAYRQLGPNVSTTVQATAALTASGDVAGVLGRTLRTASAITAQSDLQGAGRTAAATSAAATGASVLAGAVGVRAGGAVDLTGASDLAGAATVLRRAYVTLAALGESSLVAVPSFGQGNYMAASVGGQAALSGGASVLARTAADAGAQSALAGVLSVRETVQATAALGAVSVLQASAALAGTAASALSAGSTVTAAPTVGVALTAAIASELVTAALCEARAAAMASIAGLGWLAGRSAGVPTTVQVVSRVRATSVRWRGRR